MTPNDLRRASSTDVDVDAACGAPTAAIGRAIVPASAVPVEIAAVLARRP